MAQWLCDTAAPLGLVGYTTAAEIERQALAPALWLPHMLGGHVIGSWLEIGPGSGAAGLMLALASPAAYLHLMDRRERAVAFIDLTIQRFRVRNAVARLQDAARGVPPRAYTGVCFRALTEPTAALALAASLSRRWICAWHAERMAQYDSAPVGFDPVCRYAGGGADLSATLYERR